LFQKILVANDGSPGARKALAVAIELAAKVNAELHSISVEEHLPHYVATVGEFEEVKRQEDEYFAKVGEEARAMAKEYMVDLEVHVLPGHEVQTIVEFCRDNRFDLLVVGFMGHSRILERVWGSTSQSLTRLAPCSVLVVK